MYFYKITFSPDTLVQCRHDKSHKELRLGIDVLSQFYKNEMCRISRTIVDHDRSIVVGVKTPAELYKLLSLHDNGSVVEVKLEGKDIPEYSDVFEQVQGKPYQRGVRRNINFSSYHVEDMKDVEMELADRTFPKPWGRFAILIPETIEDLVPEEERLDMPYFHPGLFEEADDKDMIPNDDYKEMNEQYLLFLAEFAVPEVVQRPEF